MILFELGICLLKSCKAIDTILQKRFESCHQTMVPEGIFFTKICETELRLTTLMCCLYLFTVQQV